MTSRLDPVLRSVAAVPGAMLGTVSRMSARLRGTKPLHPVGEVGTATLRVDPESPCGVAVLDEPAEHEAVVRWSRAIGLDQDKSDIEGFALRLLLAQGPADLLFASTGSGPVGRHLLTLRAPSAHGVLTTLLPVSTPAGSLLLRLDPAPASAAQSGSLPTAYTLSWGRMRKPRWTRVGELTIGWSGADEPTRFDPVTHVLPGTRQYPWVASLREPAYGAARATTASSRTRPAG